MFSADEIVSILLGSLSDVRRVALDPLPEACDKTLLDLLCVPRHAFVGSLLGEEGDFAAPAETSLRRPRPAFASAGPPVPGVDV